MGIFADVTLLGGVTISNIYISPRYISATRDVGHYVLDYLVQKNGAALPIPSDYSIIEFKGAGREKPGDNPLRRSGVVYDRNKPAHEQVYADLREKLKAGQLPWLVNVRNEDGSPFVDGTAASVASVPEPEAEPEAPLLPAPDALMSDYGPVGTDDAPYPGVPDDFVQLMTGDETLEQAVERMTLGVDELLDMATVLSDPSLELALCTVPPERVNEWTEKLITEKARLRRLRGTVDENFGRENLVSRVQGMFAQVGAKR